MSRELDQLKVIAGSYGLERDYWLQQLPAENMPSLLPYDQHKGAVGRDFFNLDLPEPLAARLIAMSGGSDQRLHMILLASLAALAHKLSGRDQLTLTTPILTRDAAPSYLNTALPVPFTVNGEQGLKPLILAARETLKAGASRQNYPVEVLAENLGLDPADTPFPLFNLGLILENVQIGEHLDHLNLDFVFRLSRVDHKLSGRLSFSSARYKLESAQNLVTWWLTLLEKTLFEADKPLAEVSLVADAQGQIAAQNPAPTTWPETATIVSLFEQTAQRFPQRIALVHQNETLTYAQLDAAANQLAHRLQQQGVTRGDLVALICKKNSQMIIAMLAVLKAGGGYVPIDPQYPAERIQFTLHDSGAKALLVEPKFADLAQHDNLIILEPQTYADQPAEAVQAQSQPRDPAYVIYTSGTTGKPKGVMLEHRNVVRLLFNDAFQFDFDEHDVWTMFHGACFDFSVWEMYGALLRGGKLVIVDRAQARDPLAFRNICREQGVTVLNQTPSAFYQFAAAEFSADDQPLRYVIFGGEALKPARLADFARRFPETKLINMYGITETCVHVTYREIGAEEIAEDSRTIGRAIPTLAVYIVDRHGQLLPPGAPGEIWVAGDGVARGYLNRPELMAAKFADDPFVPGRRVYKSGDLGRFTADGDLEYFGRIDHQVQVRGFRVELGEIESRLNAHPDVDHSVVVAREDESGTTYLAAYYQAEKPVDTGLLYNHLLDFLPEYMVPGFFTHLTQFPLTVNGKLDLKALPEPSIGQSGTYQAPESETEKTLAAVWARILKLDVSEISVDANFFQLGGHSLKAALMVAEIHKQLHKKLPLAEVFAEPVIRTLAQRLDDMAAETNFRIQPTPEKADYALSRAQTRLFLMQQSAPQSTAYNVPFFVRLKGDLNREKLENALQQVVARHESLRTRFELKGDQPRQIIQSKAEFTVTWYDEKQQPNAAAEFIQPFDLSRAPLFRAGVLERGENDYLLMLDGHHIITDGVSQTILFQDIAAYYQGEQPAAPALQYKDYAEHQRLHPEAMENQAKFWLDSFADPAPSLELPTDKNRPAIQQLEGAVFRFRLNAEQTRALKDLAARHNCSLFMVLFTAYAAFLRKISRQDDLVIGTPVAGRDHADLESIVGMFVNMLPLRVQTQGTQSFNQLLQQVREHLPAAYENQSFPFEELVRRLDLPRDTSRHPLFDTVFSLNVGDGAVPALESLQLEAEPLDGRTAKYDLMLVGLERGEDLEFVFEYALSLFKEETIRRFAGYFQQVLKQILSNSEMPIGELDLLEAGERRMLLLDFNQSHLALDLSLGVHQRFEQQAERNPRQIAVVEGAQSQTYDQLNRRANRLAAALGQAGIGPENIVAIGAPRSIAGVTATLATLKVGAAFLPLDLKLPAARLNHMIEDSGAACTLIDQTALLPEDFQPGKTIDIQTVTEQVGNDENPILKVEPENAAYLIYTSGSTGKPKGVRLPHRALLNFLASFNRDYSGGFTEKDRCLSLTNTAFDVAVAELFLPLTAGATLVLYPETQVMDPADVAETILRENISFSYLPPSYLGEIATHLEKNKQRLPLKKLLVGVEAIRDTTLSRYHGLGVEVVNAYGPTEACICATRLVYQPGEGGIVPIGRPIANTRVYILDQDGKLAPQGSAGELHIAGRGLALGYLNREDLNRRSFIADPFQAGEAMYRSGDLARWDTQGRLHFLGRIDEQIKLRGYRIELQEIENRLDEHPEVEAARVLCLEDGAGAQLVAYLVARVAADDKTLRRFLARSLPEYMIPDHFIFLDAFPLTANGKLNRAALPRPDRKSVALVEPRDGLESKIRELWAEVLNLKAETISIEDNFHRLGGHSLKLARLAARYEQQLGVKAPLVELFRSQDIAAQAQLLRGLGDSGYQNIQPAADAESYPLTSAQERLFVLQQMELDSVTYNLPLAVILEGSVAREKVESIIRRLIQRFEPLRSRFTWIGDGPRQIIEPKIRFHLEGHPIGEDQIQQTTRDFVRPFDLAAAPLFRAGLYTIRADKHLLVFDMHHIISDGVSMGLFINQFTALWRGESLPEPQLQYKDYAVFANSDAEQKRLAEQESYWLDKLADELPTLDLPLDAPRPAVRSFEGETMVFDLDPELATDLRAVADREGASLFHVLFAAYSIFLGKLSGNRDIFVGTPTAGRRHAQLQDVFGMFVNTVVLRAQPAGHKPFSQYLAEIKEEALTAFDHQEYHFEDLVEKLNIKRDPSRNPIFDVMFALQNIDMPVIDLPDLRLKPVSADAGIAKFDLNCLCYDNGRTISFTFQYCKKLFSKAGMMRFRDYLINVLAGISRNPDVHLGNIALLGADERRLVLQEFNQTARPYAAEKLMFEDFERQAAKRPEALALSLGEDKMTYGELNAAANRLAHFLRERGVTRETPVGIVINRTMDMVVAVYAVLKAGGTYVPMEPFIPEARIDHIFNSLQIKHAITNNENLDKVAEVAAGNAQIRDLFVFDGQGKPSRHALENLAGKQHFPQNAWAEVDSANPEKINNAEDRAYVIFTSGSTGTPKGVVVRHRPVINIVEWINRTFSVGPHDKMIFVASFSFDLSVYDMFGLLGAGGCLRIVPSDDIKNPRTLLDIIMNEGITFWDSAPAALQQIAPFLHEVADYPRKSRLRLVLLSGDWIPVPLPDQLRAAFQNVQVVSLGGATEATIWSNYYLINKVESHWKSIPYGKPIQNAAYYILDDHLEPVPVGVPGDLFIGGPVLADGYAGDPELTASKFIDNPFAPGKMYRTGDRARWFADGNMEFLGRLDQQVKIRGYRVEIGEIESRLLEIEGIAETIVIARKDDMNQNYLCAYIVGVNAPDAAEVKQALARHLPEYMVPPHIIALPRIPMTVNGKVDRKALPEPQPVESGVGTPPQTENEKRIAELWAEILAMDAAQVDIDANFFELGGHSLKATRLIAEIHKRMDVRLPLAAFFNAATIRALAQQLSHGTTTANDAVTKAADAPFYPVAPAQKRLFIHQQRQPESITYNMPMLFELQGPRDLDRLRHALETLTRRHDALRTHFSLENGEPVQIISNKARLNLDIIQIEAGQEAQIAANFVRPFDLEQGPLMRVLLAEIDDQRCLFCLDMHHIITDGTSMLILMDELSRLYRGEHLAEKSLDYRDYAAWTASQARRDALTRQKQFWSEQLADPAERLKLPLDGARSNQPGTDAARHSFQIEADLAQRTAALARAHETTENTVLIAAFSVFLGKLCGQDDISIGLPVSGRERAELQTMVGMFVNTLVLRNKIEPQQSFQAFLQQVKAAARAAMENGDYPFDQLVEAHATADRPLFDVMFMLQNLESEGFDLGDLRIAPYLQERAQAKFDLSFQGVPLDGGYRFHIDYRPALFNPETIQRFADYYRETLETLVGEPQTQLADVQLKTDLYEADVTMPDLDVDLDW